MTLDNGTIALLAEQLDNAELEARAITRITDEHPQLDLDDAYAIQDEIRRRKEARGDKVAGLKVGLTSFAKMKLLGAGSPVFGFVAGTMARPDGGEIRHRELIHPRVEAEICVVTRTALTGPGCHVAAVMAAVDFVLPALEVVDSRYRDNKVDLKSMIADNTSAARFVSGGRARDLDELDLRTLGVVLEVNGEIKTMAAGAAVLGHPLAGVALLANHLSRRGSAIPAGSFIMTGGVAEACAVNPGDHVAARFQDLGTVSIRFA